MKRRPPPAGHDDTRVFRFERLFEASYRRVLAFALRRTTSEADAHDVVSETFAVLWRRLDELDDDEGVLPWLYGVSRRCLANQRRQESRRSRLTERLGGEPEAAPPGIASSDEARAVRGALDRLRAPDREILRLVAWEGLSHAEVARALGISENAVAIRMHRARRRLERVLLADGILEVEEEKG